MREQARVRPSKSTLIEYTCPIKSYHSSWTCTHDMHRTQSCGFRHPHSGLFVRIVPAYCKIGNVPRTAFGYTAYYLRGCTCIHNLVVFPIPCPTDHVLTYAQGNGARIMETCKIILTYEQILSTPK